MASLSEGPLHHKDLSKLVLEIVKATQLMREIVVFLDPHLREQEQVEPNTTINSTLAKMMGYRRYMICAVVHVTLIFAD